MPTTKKNRLAPHAIGVRSIRTAKLISNPHNPRFLFDKQPLKILENSIGKVGVLVPLTVYWGKKEKAFIILDGQRRWMCAQKLHLKEVPVNLVAEPNVVQNIVTMFQIHKFREDWELMPTALKLEVLMDQLEERNDKRLASLTGLEEAVVVRCKKLLTYSRHFQDLMLDEEPVKRVKADFFIELYPVVNDRLVTSLPWFSRDRFIKRMLSKYLKRASGLRAVTDFRKIKQHISNARRVGQTKAISSRLRQFVQRDDLTIAYLAIPAASVSASARKILRVTTKLADALRSVEVEEYYGEEELWKALEVLIRLIRSKLREAGRRPRE